jgi:hypothetical protein
LFPTRQDLLPGEIPHKQVMRSIELMGEKVIPALS